MASRAIRRVYLGRCMSNTQAARADVGSAWPWQRRNERSRGLKHICVCWAWRLDGKTARCEPGLYGLLSVLLRCDFFMPALLPCFECPVPYIHCSCSHLRPRLPAPIRCPSLHAVVVQAWTRGAWPQWTTAPSAVHAAHASNGGDSQDVVAPAGQEGATAPTGRLLEQQVEHAQACPFCGLVLHAQSRPGPPVPVHLAFCRHPNSGLLAASLALTYSRPRAPARGCEC